MVYGGSIDLSYTSPSFCWEKGLTLDDRSNSSKRLKMPKVEGQRRRRSQQLNCVYRKVRRELSTMRLGPGALAYSLSIDLSELSLGTTMKTKFPNADDILNFTLTIEPDEGMYKGGAFHFSFAINQNFPHEPPKVKCTQKIYHPNIDLEGNVCLNILREDWKPVLNLNAVIVGLQVHHELSSSTTSLLISGILVPVS